ERGMKRMIRASPTRPNAIWTRPARITVGSRYSTPWVCTSGATTSATAPAAAVIIAGRPPRKVIEIASTTEAMRLTFGSTPAITEKEMTSGIRARVVTAPASTSVVRRRGLRRACSTAGEEEDVVTGRCYPRPRRTTLAVCLPCVAPHRDRAARPDRPARSARQRFHGPACSPPLRLHLAALRDDPRVRGRDRDGARGRRQPVDRRGRRRARRGRAGGAAGPARGRRRAHP